MLAGTVAADDIDAVNVWVTQVYEHPSRCAQDVGVAVRHEISTGAVRMHDDHSSDVRSHSRDAGSWAFVAAASATSTTRTAGRRHAWSPGTFR